MPGASTHRRRRLHFLAVALAAILAAPAGIGCGPLTVAGAAGALALGGGGGGGGGAGVASDAPLVLAQAIAVPAGPSALAVGDLDRDGRLDVVVASADSAEVAVLLGRGDGTFEATTTVLAGAVAPGSGSIALVDFDRDGRLDLAVADPAGAVRLHGGLGDGSFAAPVASTTSAPPLALATGDLDRDGRPDLAVIVGDGRSVEVLLGAASGPPISTAVFSAGASASTFWK